MIKQPRRGKAERLVAGATPRLPTATFPMLVIWRLLPYLLPNLVLDSRHWPMDLLTSRNRPESRTSSGP